MKKKMPHFKDIVSEDMLCQSCKIRIGQNPHICPLFDVFGDDPTVCNCCSVCEQRCHDEV